MDIRIERLRKEIRQRQNAENKANISRKELDCIQGTTEPGNRVSKDNVEKELGAYVRQKYPSQERIMCDCGCDNIPEGCDEIDSFRKDL